MEEMEEIMDANLNDLATDIAEMEGLKEPVSIAQVKEIIACLGIRLRSMSSRLAVEYLNAIVGRAGLESAHIIDE